MVTKMSDEKNLPAIIKPASDLNLALPQATNLRNEDAEKIQAAIKKYGAFTQDGESLVNAKGVTTLLATDPAGARKMINNLPDSQKIEDGKNLFIKTAPLNQEISRRIQEPRPTLEREKLKHAEGCVNALRDHPELERARSLLHDYSKGDMKKAKRQVRESSTHCISGEELPPNAPVHHIERVADEPRKCADPKNMIAVTPDTHKTIHAEEAHDQKSLDDLAKMKGWPASQALSTPTE